MKVEEPSQTVHFQFEKRESRSFVQDRDPEVINSPRSLGQRELYAEGMIAAARHAVRRSGLESIPVLTLALANHECRITLRIGVVDVPITKLARGMVEGSNFPDAVLCRHRK